MIQVLRILATYFFGAAMCCHLPVLPADEAMTEVLLEQISANEALYHDLVATVQVSRKLGEGIEVPEGIKSLGFQPIVDGNIITRHVSQSGMYRVEFTYDRPSDAGVSREIEQVKTFDGEKTRLRINNSQANTLDKYAGDDNCVRPHMLLIKRSFFYMPLSTLLSGSKVLSTSPQASWPADREVRYAYNGLKVVGDLTCHDVIITLLDRGREAMRIELSLAVERNLIPARVTWYQLLVSKVDPVEQSEVLEWTEIEQGIWFPKKARLIKYEPIALLRQKIRRTQWEDAITTSDLSLKPVYPKSFFQSLEIPDGAAVYELKDGEIARSYRKQGLVDPNGQ